MKGLHNFLCRSNLFLCRKSIRFSLHLPSFALAVAAEQIGKQNGCERAEPQAELKPGEVTRTRSRRFVFVHMTSKIIGNPGILPFPNRCAGLPVPACCSGTVLSIQVCQKLQPHILCPGGTVCRTRRRSVANAPSIGTMCPPRTNGLSRLCYSTTGPICQAQTRKLPTGAVLPLSDF